MSLNMEVIKFDEKGLVPCICQDVHTKAVLMLAYMNRKALEKTIATNKMTYFSRSRNELWEKGLTSGHTQRLVRLSYDCDGDTLLAEVEQTGPACHTGSYSCFFQKITESNELGDCEIISALYDKIADRRENPQPKSYTNYLFEKGIDKILKKLGEECAETIIAAKNNSKEELVYETADLVYHAMVLLVNQGVTLEDIVQELKKRYK